MLTPNKHWFVCIPLLLLCLSVSGGAEGAQGAAHWSAGRAGDHRQHRGGVLLQRLHRHGAVRTRGVFAQFSTCINSSMDLLLSLNSTTLSQSTSEAITSSIIWAGSTNPETAFPRHAESNNHPCVWARLKIVAKSRIDGLSIYCGCEISLDLVMHRKPHYKRVRPGKGKVIPLIHALLSLFGVYLSGKCFALRLKTSFRIIVYHQILSGKLCVTQDFLNPFWEVDWN